MSWPSPLERETVRHVTRVDGDLDAQLLDIFFDQVPMGIAVFSTDLRLLRCNKTWAGFFTHYLGAPADWVSPGKHIFELLPGQEEAVAPLLEGVLAGNVVRQAAHQVATEEVTTYWDVVFAPTFVDGQVAGFVDIVTDATERVRTYEKLENRVAAFTVIADAMTVEHPLPRTLRQVARSVRAATGSEAAAVIVWEDDDLRDLTEYGDDGLPDGYREAVEEAYALGVSSPIRAVTTQTEVTVIRDFRSTAEADPCYAPLHPMWVGMDFQDTVVVPLGARGRCVGCLLLYVEAGRQLDVDERVFVQAIADQTAVAVENSRLFADAESHATLVERQRLARELHDSVSQALFSMTLHARAAERHLASRTTDDHDPLALSIATLSELTRGALAEMRALIFELRPRAVEEEGLLTALTRQAEAINARESLTLKVRGPRERLPVDPRAEEHVYRLVLEAMNNTLKHAGARTCEVDITVDQGADRLTVRVHDDGRGFDPDTVPAGHLGQTTMRDRATAVGGTLEVLSAPGAGCTVTLTLPIARP
ncbi:histidine kinase [Cellulomonas sp. P24]|uniref:histidine kinase n=1 Tax=Cellulomonas sp. P24 TaxID=2885206 RepID=UPI00216B0036|nr:histidine kinase [Cellulomonas sp. P24]MCR6491106.1 histidine kinase [Cellulomonas sp. P24]